MKQLLGYYQQIFDNYFKLGKELATHCNIFCDCQDFVNYLDQGFKKFL